MQPPRHISFLLGVALFAVAPAGLAAVPPGSNFDLSHWKLTLPVDASGGTSGTAVEVKNPTLRTYSSEFFYTDTDGAMVFWCPVIGAWTSGATAPRTELRELIDGNDSAVNWTAAGTHVLRAQCRVTQLPDTGAVIIGQVHGYPAQRLVKVQYDAGRVQAYIRNSLTLSGDTKFSWGVSPGALIDYEIKVVDGVATITVNGIPFSHNFGLSDPAWLTTTFYFKAGAYLQDNSGPVTEGGRVSFYQVSVTHGTVAPLVVAPTITTNPVSQTVAAGANVTLTVGASGTPPFNYQWRANGVNLPGQTGSSLTLTGFRSTDQKNYDAIVSNSAGSATSAAASLYLNAPLRFINSRTASNRFTTTLLGVAGTTCVLEATTNLTTWTPLATNSSSTGINNFSITNSSSAKRFYRAR
jgi:hypothetical protein